MYRKKQCSTPPGELHCRNIFNQFQSLCQLLISAFLFALYIRRIKTEKVTFAFVKISYLIITFDTFSPWRRI